MSSIGPCAVCGEPGLYSKGHGDEVVYCINGDCPLAGLEMHPRIWNRFSAKAEEIKKAKGLIEALEASQQALNNALGSAAANSEYHYNRAEKMKAALEDISDLEGIKISMSCFTDGELCSPIGSIVRIAREALKEATV